MIVAVDHTVLVCPNLRAAIADFTLLLGHPPTRTTESADTETAYFEVDNTALELLAPRESGEQAKRLRQILDKAAGPALTSIVFASDLLEDDHHRFSRRGLGPGDVMPGSHSNRNHFRLSDELLAGIKAFVIEQPDSEVAASDAPADHVHSMDHLVVTTSDPERAVANYGGRLGINLALDRTEEKWGVRFLFFRVGGLTLEIVHKLKDPIQGPDCLWGVTWAVKDLPAARARLEQAGVSTSEIRTGRKRGSEVFTVKSHTLGVPTLFIAHKPRSN